jgi:RNA polymerase sigma-70 factor (ECF subfamily)
MLEAFAHATASGDVSQLAALLRADAIALTDGGGRKTAALKPIHGADKVARFFIGLASKQEAQVRIEPATINGVAGLRMYLDGELDHVISLAISGGQIAAIYVVRNPDKLRYVTA